MKFREIYSGRKLEVEFFKLKKFHTHGFLTLLLGCLYFFILSRLSWDTVSYTDEKWKGDEKKKMHTGNGNKVKWNFEKKRNSEGEVVKE